MKDPRRRAINAFERIGLNIADLAARLTRTRQPLDHWDFRQGRHIRPDEYRFDTDWQPYAHATQWGGQDVTCWFRTTAIVPDTMADQEVIARLFPGGEAILRVNGRPAGGLDFNHREFVLTACAPPGQRFDLELECYFRDAPDDAIRNDVRLFHTFENAELAVVDRELEALWYDLTVALDLATAAEACQPDLSAHLLAVLQSVVAQIDPYEPDPARYREKASAARERLEEQLATGLGAAKSPGRFDLVGHCHIDLWYTWPYRESVRKNLRTNLIASDLLRRNPDCVFSQSQAKLFADMQQHFPESFAEVQRLARAGRFEPIGDMWVEPDGNIPGGEATIRQILYGRAYFRDTLGSPPSAVCWMPDVFGVSRSLPQILVQAGYRVFYTNKQAIWHDTNEFPHSTFWWEGIDGSRIVAHIPPTHFVGKMDPAALLAHWAGYPQKEQAPRVLYTYGFGDGGGGPTDAMLHYARRLARLGGVADMQFARVEDFARALTAEAHDLPVWPDELYLEMHRGAPTSKGPLKWLNRRAEAGLRGAELLAAVAAIRAGQIGDPKALEPLWKRLLECHFHDAITGTHCTEAGQEIAAQYESILVEAAASISRSLAALAPAAPNRRTVFNLTGHATAGHVFWQPQPDEPATTLADHRRPLPAQRLRDGRYVAFVDGLPELGHRTFETITAGASADGSTPIRFGDTGSVESPHYRAQFRAGQLVSLVDRAADREVLAGPGNMLRLYEDKPGRFEAWDIAKDYRDRPIDAIRFLGDQAGESGPLLSSRVFRWSVGQSQLRQEVIFYTRSRRIDFRTQVDWGEERTLLRVEFPLAVRTGQATYEIAFGTISRSTQPVTSFEWAKFEVPLHRWMAVSEFGYGVALLNDSKYGGCARDGVVSLSLLKSPRFPDPTSDRGQHRFTYSLLPYAGDWQSAGVLAEAALLNDPLRLAPGGADADRLSYVTVDRPGVSVEAFKPAEDGKGFILRLVDYFGQRGPTTATLPGPARSIAACNVLEEPANESPAAHPPGRIVRFVCRPFGIHSFRLTF